MIERYSRKEIKKMHINNRVGDIGNAIQDYINQHGYGIVKELVGHGLGKNLHEEPEIPNYGKLGTGKILKDGLVLAIEPMINIGGYETKILNDGWTAVKKDKSLSAQFEHTIGVTKDGCEIFTQIN